MYSLPLQSGQREGAIGWKLLKVQTMIEFPTGAVFPKAAAAAKEYRRMDVTHETECLCHIRHENQGGTADMHIIFAPYNIFIIGGVFCVTGSNILFT